MRQGFFRLGALIIAAVLAFNIQVTEAAKGIKGSPKIMNLFLNWQLKEEDLPKLARWDVVVLDADQQARYPDRVKKLKQLNPDIKLLAYIATEEIANARFSEPPEYPFAKMAAHIQDAWYLQDPNSNKTYFWPGSAMLNVTDVGPVGADGERWNEYLPRFIRDEIMSTGLWDGVFLDNTFEAISYYVTGPVDLNRDGWADNTQEADQAWRDGMKKMLGAVRDLNPDAIMIGNGGLLYADQLDGALFEHFPSWDWATNWKQFRETIAANSGPSYTGINVNTDNQERPEDYRLMRYGLGNAMVGGGYYSFDQGSSNHDVLWWYDEYEVPLGAPQSEPRILAGASGTDIVPAVWGRTFENGLVLVNSTNTAQKIDLPGVFEKIKGAQDPVVNSGEIVTNLELNPNDGIVLLRRTDAAGIWQTAFQNGAFIRMYDKSGRQTQSGFFAALPEAKSGDTVMSADLDGDKQPELITAQAGVLSITSTNKPTVVFAPFGDDCQTKLSLAAGQFNDDRDLELALACDGALSSTVKIFSRNGTQLAAWEAYAKNFTGGVRLAAGDLDGDGKDEIVTGAGAQGGPHVKIWNANGLPQAGGFFAFDPTEQGGIYVAVGDVDGDHKNEIIVGSGQGALPRVRIFSSQGTRKAEIRLSENPQISGVQVATSDMNSDGIKEILVSQLSFF